MTAPLPASGASAPIGNLADHVARLDATRFVGRADVLDPIEALLRSGGRGRVVFVHGPGGIGKSAVLREIGRRARLHGRPVHTIDGRLLNPSAEAFVTAFDSSAADELPVILIDSFEQISALAAVLRDEVLPNLPASSLIVLAGRLRPGAIWFRDGWEHIVQDIALRPLTDPEADQLLAQHEISGESARQTRSWAKGSPLALQVAASAAAGAQPPTTEELADTIASRLIGDDLDDADAEVVAVAAVARAVDEHLVADALPYRSTGSAYQQFRLLSVVEPYGRRLALNDLVRDALREDLRRRNLDTYRQLVGRIADHLHGRILAGELNLLDELTALIEDPVVRAHYSRGRGADFRAGMPEPGDVDELGTRLDATGSQWWAGIERFFLSAPEVVTVVRSSAGDLAGFAIAMAPATAPAWAAEDAVIGPLLTLARSRVPEGNVTFWRDCVNLLGRDDPGTREVIALLNYPTYITADLVRSREVYGAIGVDDAPGWSLRTMVGAIRAPGVQIHDGERDLGAYILDNGPGLLVGNVRNVVYAGQGLPPPDPSTVDGDGHRAALRTALQEFHDPVALATNPLAEGAGLAERAEFVRARLRSAVATVFGTSETERELRRMIERAYFDPDGGHRRAMTEAHLARSTYFRRLSEATARINAGL